LELQITPVIGDQGAANALFKAPQLLQEKHPSGVRVVAAIRPQVIPVLAKTAFVCGYKHGDQ
jgi:hypothetical protein